MSDRRALLEALAGSCEPPLTLAPATTDPGRAAAWFTDLVSAGLEGLVVKGRATTYPAGRREWVKVKHRATLEVIGAAVVGPVDRPRSLVAGLPIDGALRIVGRTGQLSATNSAQLGALLRLHDPATGPHPWPGKVPPSWFDRYTSDKDPVVLTRVLPLVVESAADTARSGIGFRHQLRYLRAQPDLDAEAITSREG